LFVKLSGIIIIIIVIIIITNDYDIIIIIVINTIISNENFYPLSRNGLICMCTTGIAVFLAMFSLVLYLSMVLSNSTQGYLISILLVFIIIITFIIRSLVIFVHAMACI